MLTLTGRRVIWIEIDTFRMEIGMANNRKPILAVPEQIEHLKRKGVKFERITEKTASDYLMHNNNYFKLSAYRKNYPKYIGGQNDGKYIDLDFAYLRDLAIIDLRLRYTFVQMALDIEHYAKLEILRIVELHETDGYTIVENYLNSLEKDQRDRLLNEIDRNRQSIYCRDLFIKYQNNFPIWVFIEMISFGRMTDLYRFCASRYGNKNMRQRYFLLQTCKGVRNASAHSSCILNDLHINTANRNTHYYVFNALSKITTISPNTRAKKMSNARLQQCVTLLYTYNIVVTSNGAKKNAHYQLTELSRRILEHIDYYDNNALVKSSLVFLNEVIKAWF